MRKQGKGNYYSQEKEEVLRNKKSNITFIIITVVVNAQKGEIFPFYYVILYSSYCLRTMVVATSVP